MYRFLLVNQKIIEQPERNINILKASKIKYPSLILTLLISVGFGESYRPHLIFVYNNEETNKPKPINLFLKNASKCNYAKIRSWIKCVYCENAFIAKMRYYSSLVNES